MAPACLPTGVHTCALPSPFGGEPDAVTCFGDQNVPQ